MELFLQQLFNGIMFGSTYAIVALGLTLVMGILHIPNFAHGHLYMLGGYITYFFITNLGFGYWYSLLLSMVILGFVGVVMERIVFRPLTGQPPINAFIAAIGALIFLESLALVIWGPQGMRIPNPHPQIIKMFGITMEAQRLLVVGGAAVLIVLLHLFLKKTTTGTTIEAVAQNREGAMLTGINVNRVSSMTFFISSATAAVAASFLSPIFILSPAMGAVLGMKAFIIVILGGMGSVPGAILGGYFLGLIEALGGGYISAEYKDVFAFGALILVLSIKPTGLFGKQEG
ncbi:MAG: branched-chain amino acid ABC transporter permease [Proteobacteria bacterium]|nr:branched-chain amino acid ABC transporter permease [Pseudomonadota bacterium]MBU1388018.1 branched-chain amino acid ABC transporter permease [Pseudomonadota bacterium]MBU1542081.1 branched-chain amino acid ABC transporter permease [Pseudomonadota bacterium]MBU2430448.1 branched-chain amino acid ABC transporter permease [Pseudomonadota bacterium]MBU2482865.1 branched-chain amino acid ABC transporter permease [Pseudomonadota bacterium]